ncbi:UNVERIFIED_CONTAM: hypothetical protein Slati_1339300 [Sesamum latifolium]|uniref:Reverse transcriptase domain-containing protein n=1 Tax=Sesamum latifolium TaxID=2727402 RepID=A0AAW2XHG2_9LAMI
MADYWFGDHSGSAGIFQKREASEAAQCHFTLPHPKDDLLLFRAADVSYALLIKEALEELSRLSGLQANTTKTHVILSKSATQVTQDIVSILLFQIGILPIERSVWIDPGTRKRKR